MAVLLPMAGHAQSIHFDGVDGSPAWAPRFERAIRDSLKRRGVDLWAAESLAYLKDRNEWPGPERTTAQLSWLSKRTKRTTIAWARSTSPQGRFERPWWSILWTRRVWNVSADIFVADAAGKTTSTQVSIERRIWLGFTGTNRADLWPITDPERANAEALLLAELTSKAMETLAPQAAQEAPAQ